MKIKRKQCVYEINAKKLMNPNEIKWKYILFHHSVQ